jgi:hypothetical protein
MPSVNGKVIMAGFALTMKEKDAARDNTNSFPK